MSEQTKRLKLTITYDGAPWQGWQSLSNQQGVQDQIERAFATAVDQRVRLHGSGRTDAGVHALAQVAHVDVRADLVLSPEAWINALNACLPPSIRIIACGHAPPRFHARYDAIGKIYRYRIWRARILDPFQAGRAWHLHGDLDERLLHDCAGLLRGTHNFARLSANRGHMTDEERREDEEGMTRTITRVDIRSEGDALEIELQGDGFLYKMVRMIVGSMIHVARGRESLDWFRKLLDDPTGLKTNQTAPADGLYLVRVIYTANKN